MHYTLNLIKSRIAELKKNFIDGTSVEADGTLTPEAQHNLHELTELEAVYPQLRLVARTCPMAIRGEIALLVALGLYKHGEVQVSTLDSTKHDLTAQDFWHPEPLPVRTTKADDGTEVLHDDEAFLDSALRNFEELDRHTTEDLRQLGEVLQAHADNLGGPEEFLRRAHTRLVESGWLQPQWYVGRSITCNRSASQQVDELLRITDDAFILTAKLRDDKAACALWRHRGLASDYTEQELDEQQVGYTQTSDELLTIMSPHRPGSSILKLIAAPVMQLAPNPEKITEVEPQAPAEEANDPA